MPFLLCAGGDASIFVRPDGDVHPSRKRHLQSTDIDSGKRSRPSTERELTSEISTAGVDSRSVDSSEQVTGHHPTTADEDLYRTGAKCVPGGIQDGYLPGTGYHVTGVLRTKPGRGDPTESMSCSDKITRWNVLGCQGCFPMMFLERPIYVDMILIAGYVSLFWFVFTIYVKTCIIL